MELRPLILITNDDGVNAKGLRSLIDIASKFGDLLIVAPDTHQSDENRVCVSYFFSPLF